MRNGFIDEVRLLSVTTVGTRYFLDIDLLVPKREREKAFQEAASSGFFLRSPLMPKGFCARHHLHWSLHKKESDTFCDLHWALDHPYKLFRIDYDAIFERAVEKECDGFTWRQPFQSDVRGRCVAFLWPDPSYFRARTRAGLRAKRVGHLLYAVFRLGGAGGDAACCLGWAAIRKKRRRPDRSGRDNRDHDRGARVGRGH